MNNIEQSRTHDADVTQLHLASLGFLIYPVNSATGRCPAILAPHVEGVEHQCGLLMLGDIEDTQDIELSRRDNAHMATLHDTLITFETDSSPATVRDFDLIVPFESICCNAAPQQQALQAPQAPEAVSVSVRLDGGTLWSVPDENTSGRQWRWIDCAGQEVKKPLSSLTLYEKPVWPSRTLTFAPRREGGTKGTILFRGPKVFLAMLHVPLKDEVDPAATDLAHVASTLRLCHPSPNVHVAFGEECPDPGTWPEPDLPEPVKVFLGLGAMLKGRPNCGARTLWL